MLRIVTILLVAACAALAPEAEGAVRIKDLVRFEGVHDNAVLGYGIVVGLSGTGDSSRNYVTQQSVSNMLRDFGVNVPATSLNSRNAAAVVVSANLHGAVRPGDHIDVNVAALGDAHSLAGGTLPADAAVRESIGVPMPLHRALSASRHSASSSRAASNRRTIRPPV